MSIISVGSDIVECLRIAQLIDQHGESFLRRIYSQSEVDFCSARGLANQHYAARWAAKKAVLQALGVGMRGGMNWKDIEVRSQNGTFTAGLAGVVRDVSVSRGVQKIHLSLSSCRTMAMAVAILESDDKNEIDFSL